MRFHIITIFPNIFDSYLSESIIGRAIKNKLIRVESYNPRDFIKVLGNNYRPVDDKPYGGGPGMVMRAEPVLRAVEVALGKIRDRYLRIKNKRNQVLIINFIPSAEKFTTVFAKKISKKYTDVILICGRYEGIDGRVDKILRQTQDKFSKFKQISIGDYILTGGELPAMAVIDCISRQIPGVLGKYESLEEERVSTSEVYTRPEVLKWLNRFDKNGRPISKASLGKNKSYKVPGVLLSGHRAKIEEWKKRKDIN